MEKINNKLTKLFKLKINWFVTLSFVIIFILLLLHHLNISMYFDDYGNASLSYSYLTPNVQGTNFTFAQLLEWAGNIYQNWGGRILYAICFIIPLLKNGITAYMFIQTFVITGIIYFMYKIIKSYTKKNVDFIPLVLFILYALIDMCYLRHGIYWASASVLYIWPLLPLTMLIYFYRKLTLNIKDKKKVNWLYIPLLILLSFFSAFSQEQIGVAVIVFVVAYILFDHLKDFKKYLKIDVPVLLTSIISYLFLFFAPGNWVRMDSNVEFAKMSFFEKIISNYPRVLEAIFMEGMPIFIFLLSLAMIYMIYKLYKDKYKGNKKFLCLVAMIPVLLALKFYMKFFVVNVSRNNISFLLFSTIWLITMLITSILYLKEKKKLNFLAFEFATVSSVFCLLLSPTVGGRTTLPFIFMIFIIICVIYLDIFYDKNILFKTGIILLFIILGIMGARNYLIIYRGYVNNKAINDLNDNILKNYDSKNKTIKLYKLENSWFGSTQSYEEPSMDFWIKEYYNIPQNVTFEWIDLYNKN